MNTENKHDLLNIFLDKWPVSRLKNLTIEEYSNHQNNSFTYDVEFGLLKNIGGIQGSTSYHYGLFKMTDNASRNKSNTFYNNGEYAWYKKYGNNVDEVFQTIKKNILQIIESTKKNDLESVNKIIDSSVAHNYGWKIAFIYGNYNIVNIFKEEVLKNELKNIGESFDNKIKMSDINRILISRKPDSMDYFEYCDNIWDRSILNKSIDDNQDLDFDNVMVYEVKKSAADNFEDLIHDNKKYFYWNQKKFTNLNIDDYVFLINTTNKYSSLLKLNKKNINIAVKGNNSSFSDEGQKFNVDGTYKKFVRLEIIESFEKDYNWKTLGVSENTYLYGEYCDGLNPANIYRVNQLKDIYKKNTKATEILNTCLNGHNKSSPMKITQSLNVPTQSLNRILFGPPGTGKTFSTINHALSILEDVALDKLKGEERKEVRERYEKFVNDDLKQIRFTTFHQSYSYEDFIEGIRPKLVEIEDNDSRKEISYDTEDGVFKNIVEDAILNYPEKYVLIIDEINRGNISDILGELITLLEPSKRREGDESTKVTLPYSKDSFEIPDNIYIVGTMNTADRSISVLDTALRRRFDFIELPPNYDDLSSLLKKKEVDKEKSLKGIDLIEILKTINERIGFLLDKDHMIGHTYFMTVTNKESLVKVFSKNIIPLLGEYFHNDYENIRRVLGDHDGWGKNKNHQVYKEKLKNSDELFRGELDGFEDVKTYELNKYFTEEKGSKDVPKEVFIEIYKSNK